MISNIKLFFLKRFERLGYKVSKQTDFDTLVDSSRLSNNYRLLIEEYRSKLNGVESLVDFNRDLDFLDFLFEHKNSSTSQISQDLMVLYVLNKKKNGFFVEFGATDGKGKSNTYILEKEFGWTGILCEPSKKWHTKLSSNRNCKIDHRCVWSASKEDLLFCDTKNAEFSSINQFVNFDIHKLDRVNSYYVQSVSLNDLLAEHQAPNYIDYLSVDTEGSEYDILKVVDFDRYSFGVISVEHNFTPNRELIASLLISKGYKNVYSTYSQFDDWYVLDRVEESLGFRV